MEKKSNYAWWIFAGTCLISLVGFGLIINTIGLFFEPISAAFHVGRTEVALMSTFQNIAAALVLIFAGKIMSKISVKWLLVICFTIMGCSLASLSLAKSMYQFYIVWTVIGICQPFSIVLSIPVLLGNWFKEKLGTVMGIALGITAIGGTIFNILISNVITAWGWRNGWLVEGLLVLFILVPVSLFIIKDKPSGNQVPYSDSSDISTVENEDSESDITLHQAVKTPMFYLISFAMIALQLVAGFVQHISAYIVSIGKPLTLGATIVSGVMLGAAIGKIAIGYMLDKFNNSLVIIIYTFFGIVGWGGLLAFRVKAMLILCGFILGMGQGFLLVALPFFIRKQFGSKDYSNILSIINMFGSVSSAASVSIDGMFFDITKSYSLPLIMNVLFYILAGFSVILSIMLSKKYINNKKEEI